MSRLVWRIVMTILLIPSAAVLEFVAFIFLDNFHRYGNSQEVLIAALITAAYMAGYWLLLWRREVIWTAMRVRETWWSAAGAIFAGAAMAWGVRWVLPFADGLDKFIGVHLAIVLWLMATCCIWRETADERGARLSRGGFATLVCPSCNYNLTGLREARCPECGAAYTLDQLYAAQPGREAAEIDRG